MGNGASGTITIEGETYDMQMLSKLLPDLKRQLQDKTTKLQHMTDEVQEKDRLLNEKDNALKKMKAEVDKLKSVLQLKVTDSAIPGSKPDILAAIGEESVGGLLAPERAKRQGISGESSAQQQTVQLKHVDKEFRYVFLIPYPP